MDIKLVIVKGAKKKQVIRLSSDETILGRQHGCDLRIPSPQVSRRHCRLSVQEEGLVVEDLASANGCYLNGVRIEGQETVRPGDLLEVGPLTFRVEFGMTVSPRGKDEFDVLPVAADSPRPPSLPSDEGTEEPIEYAELHDDSEVLPQKKSYSESIPLSDLEDETTAPAAADSSDVTMEMEDITWQAPSQDNIRDILSQLDEE